MSMPRIIVSAVLLSCCATGTFAQDPSPAPEIPANETQEDKAARTQDADFDESIMEFGKLAGAAYACLVNRRRSKAP